MLLINAPSPTNLEGWGVTDRIALAAKKDLREYSAKFDRERSR